MPPLWRSSRRPVGTEARSPRYGEGRGEARDVERAGELRGRAPVARRCRSRRGSRRGPTAAEAHLMAPRLVVPPPAALDTAAARAFAERVRARGASFLELRTALPPASSVEPAALAEQIDLLVAERGTPLPAAWLA